MDKSAIFDRYQDGMRRNVPAHMHGGVHRYVTHGVRPGDFLYLLLCDREEEAYRHADMTNSRNKEAWRVFIDRYLPPECHGSGEKVQTWIDHRGLEGVE